jgi:GT2 family glycosyltransferase
MKVGFVCVNYNNSRITIDYISNLLFIKKGYDVIVVIVDNASKQDELEILENYIENEDIILIKSDLNLGYFKGLNLGLSVLNTSEFDYIVVGNNDLKFQDDFLEQLEVRKSHDNALVLSPNIIRPDGVHQNPHMINKFNAVQKVYRRIYYSNYYISIFLQFIYGFLKKLTKTDDRSGNLEEQIIIMGYGACYVLTKKFFDFFISLDAPNFLMGEEGVLANQVLSVNGITIYCPDLVVEHLDHTSIGKLPTRRLFELNRQAYKHFIRSCKHVH